MRGLSSQRFSVAVDCGLVGADGLGNALGDVLLAFVGYHVGFVFGVADESDFKEDRWHQRTHQHHETGTAHAACLPADFSAVHGLEHLFGEHVAILLVFF